MARRNCWPLQRLSRTPPRIINNTQRCSNKKKDRIHIPSCLHLGKACVIVGKYKVYFIIFLYFSAASRCLCKVMEGWPVRLVMASWSPVSGGVIMISYASSSGSIFFIIWYNHLKWSKTCRFDIILYNFNLDLKSFEVIWITLSNPNQLNFI